MTHQPTLDQLADRLLSLLVHDTSGGREDAMLPTLLDYLQEIGLEVLTSTLSPGRTNVLAMCGAPRILFTTHLDVVAPFVQPRRVADRVLGRGSCDAKGQIVCQLEAIRALMAEGFEGVAWLGVVGEETDAAGAKEAHSWAPLLRSVELLVAGEPTQLRLATGQRGFLHLRLFCGGRAAHSGTPQLGRSAILALLDWLEAIRQRATPTHRDLGPEVTNIGRIEGGTAINVIPDHASAEILCRTIPGSSFERHIEATCPPGGHYETILREEPQRFAELAGWPTVTVPFGSDLPQLHRIVPQAKAVLVGPGDITHAHTEEEQIDLHELTRGIDQLSRLGRSVLAEETSRCTA